MLKNRIGNCLLGVALLLPGALYGSSGEAVKTFTGQATVQVVEVPVRVFDPSDGSRVRGLKAADFEIFENGEKREITNFSEIDIGTRAPAGIQGETPTQAEYRQMIYFFDLYLMEPRDRDRALEALRRQYAHGARPLELVSIAAFDGTMRALLDSSRDRGKILKALDEISKLKAHGISQRIVFTNALTSTKVSGERKLDYYERRQRSREFMVEMERRVQRVGNAVLTAIQRFSGMEGRKILIVFSPGQPKTSWAPSFSPIDYINGDVAYPAQDLWENLALEASDLGFALYVIDSSGTSTSSDSDASAGLSLGSGVFGGGDGPNRLPDTEEASAGVADPGSNQAPQNLGQWLERTRKNMLKDAAGTTGGESIFSKSILDAVDGIERQWRHWYSLAYTVDHPNPGAEKKIEVRLLKHREYRLEYRRAYRRRSAAEQDGEKMRSAMLFSSEANPLGIRVEFGEPKGRFHLGASRAKRVRIPIAVRIPLGRLEFLPQGDLLTAKVLLSFFSRDDKANQSPLAREEQRITVEKARFEEAMRGGYFTYRITVETEGGKQKISVGVQDDLSRKRSIVSRDFDF